MAEVLSIFAIKRNDLKVLTTIPETRSYLSRFRQDRASIGLVPTMGALHEGHLSLVRQCISENEFSVVSIFVNPSQFNDNSDFVRYPRDLDKDLGFLRDFSCNMVFAPSVEEMYPEKDLRRFEFGNLDRIMEGSFRPGHFNGVAQIVSKLFTTIEPDRAYFGEKDFQQLMIIKYLVRSLDIPVEVIGSPIVRDTDGLALSSRNQLLSKQERDAAAFIPKTLFEAVQMNPRPSPAKLKNHVIQTINSNPLLKVEYVEIADELELAPVRDWSDSVPGRIFTAVWCGSVRLIDNVKIS